MRTYSERASLYIGVKQGSKKHHNIIDYYNNNIKPLPRGYRVQYSDNWCATFVSVILKQCQVSKDVFECGANRMMLKFKELDALIENDKGKKNDIIFYDWNNDSWCDHVGIISGISGKYYNVIEGNYNKQVAVRKILKKSKNIFAIARI